MRRKRVELQEAVIVAARDAVSHVKILGGIPSCDRLIEAVYALDNHDAASLTGSGARWAAGSETSREAAIRATPIQGSTRYRIVKILSDVSSYATDEGLESLIHGKHQTVSSARNWLVEAGWLRDSGRRQKNRSGRDAVCWELTEAGLRQLRKGI